MAKSYVIMVCINPYKPDLPPDQRGAVGKHGAVPCRLAYYYSRRRQDCRCVGRTERILRPDVIDRERDANLGWPHGEDRFHLNQRKRFLVFTEYARSS